MTARSDPPEGSAPSHRHPFIAYRPEAVSYPDALRRGQRIATALATRRSVRAFSRSPVPKELIEIAVSAASTAPSAAHRQPWFFAATSDAALKHRIRIAVEEEERRFYREREVDSWREAVAPLETTEHKGYLDVAPWLVVVFAQKYVVAAGGTVQKNYYVNESVGIACGIFIASLHMMGLATLPYRPSAMQFVQREMGRPDGERAYLMFPIGYPAADVEVPDLRRKALAEVLAFRSS